MILFPGNVYVCTQVSTWRPMLQEMKCSYTAVLYKWLLRLGRPTCVEEYVGRHRFFKLQYALSTTDKQQPREACQKKNSTRIGLTDPSPEHQGAKNQDPEKWVLLWTSPTETFLFLLPPKLAALREWFNSGYQVPDTGVGWRIPGC